MALVIGAVPTALTAQTATTAHEEPMSIEVIPLRHLEPGAAEELFSQLDLGEVYMVANEDPPQIVLQGAARAVDAAKRLLAKLDVAPEERAEEHTEFLPVHSYPLGELVGLLHSSYGAGRIRLGVDELNHRLVVTDTVDMIHRIRSFVEQADRPERSFTLSFFFIRGRIAGGGGVRDGEFPEPLLPIAETLMANGFGDLSLMAPIIIRTSDGEEFNSEATLQLGTDSGALETLSFSVEGRVIANAQADQVRLIVEAGMHGLLLRTESTRSTSPAKFHLATTLSTEVGRYVVLAAAPSSTANGNLLALVVRVTSDQ